MARTRYHMHLSVKGMLRKGRAELKRFAKSCKGTDGKPMTVDQVQDFLLDELAQGHEAYPMGECDNFDWKTGCKGHPVEDTNG